MKFVNVYWNISYRWNILVYHNTETWDNFSIFQSAPAPAVVFLPTNLFMWPATSFKVNCPIPGAFSEGTEVGSVQMAKNHCTTNT